MKRNSDQRKMRVGKSIVDLHVRFDPQREVLSQEQVFETDVGTQESLIQPASNYANVRVEKSSSKPKKSRKRTKPR